MYRLNYRRMRSQYRERFLISLEFGDDQIIVDDEFSSAFEVDVRIGDIRHFSHYGVMRNKISVLQVAVKTVTFAFDKVFDCDLLHNVACFYPVSAHLFLLNNGFPRGLSPFHAAV